MIPPGDVHELRHLSPQERRDDYNDGGESVTGSVTGSVGSAEDLNPIRIDKIMAKEIDRLSIKDRNAIYEEIHGVSTMAIEETSELMEESLKNFSMELNKIDAKLKRAYNVIANQETTETTETTTTTNALSKEIVESKDFRLRFLRCVSFDPSQAAERMVQFFELLQRVYGIENLKKFDGTMDFFIGGTAEQNAFRAGYIQLLPFRDRSGRRILSFVTDALSLDHIIRFKIFMYMVFVAGEDPETQRNGVVMLFWPGTLELQLPSPSYRKLVGQYIRCSPTRIISFHFCFPPTPFFLMLRTVISAALQVAKRITRVKVHTGERTELQYQLMGFGIPVSLIPTTGTGTLKTKVFLQWAKARKILESSRKKKQHHANNNIIIINNNNNNNNN